MDQDYVAKRLYDVYCEAVGGKAFNGDVLPTSDVFFADESKKKQVDAWKLVGKTAEDLLG